MNSELTNAILYHILLNLGLNKTQKNTIFNDLFITNNDIEYVNEFDEMNKSSVYSCQMKVNNSSFQIICAKLSTDYKTSIDEDVYFVIKLEGCPTYGCYLSVNTDKMEDVNNQSFHDGFIACFIDNKHWVPAPVFIQATFLAGMEQLRELSAPFTKVDSNEELFNNLKSFITYKESYMNEGQED